MLSFNILWLLLPGEIIHISQKQNKNILFEGISYWTFPT